MDSASTHIDAPPERVWELIADVTRMGQWSPNCYRCEWIDGASGPAVGARFRGRNRRGLARWSTVCAVTAAEPGREFAFSVTGGVMAPGVNREMTRWRYVLAPAGDGTDVTETAETVWLPPQLKVASLFSYASPFKRLGAKLSGRPVEGRRDSMQATLGRLKAAAESQGASSGSR